MRRRLALAEPRWKRIVRTSNRSSAIPTPKRSSVARANYWPHLARRRTLDCAVAASLCRGVDRVRPGRRHSAVATTPRAMLAADPDEDRGKSTMRSTPRGRGVLHQRTTPETQKSTISHRGFHDTKNGGFSTIGRTRVHAILTTSNASPPQAFLKDFHFSPASPCNAGAGMVQARSKGWPGLTL